jgi:hypothetical protein
MWRGEHRTGLSRRNAAGIRRVKEESIRELQGNGEADMMVERVRAVAKL